MKFLDDKELNIVSGGHAWNPWHSSTAIKSAFDDGTGHNTSHHCINSTDNPHSVVGMYYLQKTEGLIDLCVAIECTHILYGVFRGLDFNRIT